MSLTLQAVFTNKYPTSVYLSYSRTHFLKSSNFALSLFNSKTHFPDYRFFPSYGWTTSPLANIKASFEEPYVNSQRQGDRNGTTFAGSNFDSFLSILEFLSLASSAAISLLVALSNGMQKKEFLNWVGTKILVWQCVVLVSGVVAGAVLRRRQWMLISGATFSKDSAPTGVHLLERVDKMEEDLRSVATIIRVLSRQLEKLGIRFRITRKAMIDPIEQTAALAQKNSEATRALAAQEDNLEKELGEIQKVLLAMQEQQQKQLELILAIGKSGKLWDTKRLNSREDNPAPKAFKESPSLKMNQTEAMALKEANTEAS